MQLSRDLLETAAEAQLQKDNVDLARAKATFEHQETMAKRRPISRKAIDKSRKIYEQAQRQAHLEEATVAQHAAERRELKPTAINASSRTM